MSDSDKILQPTMNLRYVMREFSVNPVAREVRPVLQQMFQHPNGGYVWRDIPIYPLDTPNTGGRT